MKILWKYLFIFRSSTSRRSTRPAEESRAGLYPGREADPGEDLIPEQTVQVQEAKGGQASPSSSLESPAGPSRPPNSTSPATHLCLSAYICEYDNWKF